jgi:hypothetical protein
MSIILFVILFVLAFYTNIASGTSVVPILECPNENFKTNFSISGHPGSLPRQQTFVYFCYKKDGILLSLKKNIISCSKLLFYSSYSLGRIVN